MIMKVFCGDCGKHFSAEENSDLFCPKCGSMDIYQDTLKGSDTSIKVLTEYENSIED